MKKQIIALAIAAAVSAPAMADITLYGTVAVDFINAGTKNADNSVVERDDVIFGMKAASETDGGLLVGGEIKTEGDFADPTLAYVKVGTDVVTLWAGKIGNPADAADAADFSNTGNATHFAGEIDNTVAVTIGAGGFSAAIGGYQAAAVKAKAAKSDGTTLATAASDTDGTIAQVGYSAGGVSANIGYVETGMQKTTGVKVGYAADAFSVAVYNVKSDNLTVSTGNYAGTHNEVSTTGLTGSVMMGATTVSAIVAQDEVTGYKQDATINGDQDIFALKVSQALGGGLTAYAEYGSNDGDLIKSYKAYTVGMSYSF